MLRNTTKDFKKRALHIDSSKKVNSKVKGNRAELAAAKALTKWTGAPWRRVPMSGAMHIPIFYLCGDLFIASSFVSPWSVEVKHYKKVTPGMIKRFWEQTCEDAARIDKLPFLMVKENGLPKNEWMIFMNKGKAYFIDRLSTIGLSTPLPLPAPGIPDVYMLWASELFKIDFNEFRKHL